LLTGGLGVRRIEHAAQVVADFGFDRFG